MMSKNRLVIGLGLILLAAVLPGNAAIQADSVEIRGTVATGASSWNANNFPGLWYDLKDDLKTENFAMTYPLSGRTIPENSLWYNTTKVARTLKVYANGHTNTELENVFNSPLKGMYELVGWQGKPYVAVKSKANKLSKLVIEQGNAASDKKTLAVGETWDIGDGWTLSAKGINTNSVPKQTWLVLSRDGVEVDDRIIAQGEVYVYIENSLAGETDVPLFVTYVDSIFSDPTNKVQLRYTWAISKNVTEIKVNDVFGNLEAVQTDSNAIKLRNKDKTITLTRDTLVDITGNIKFKVADSDTLRFYPLILETDSGIYDVRGHVTTESTSWDATDFAALWYDLKDDLKTENLAITEPLAGRIIPANSLWYNTTKTAKTMKVYANGQSSAALENAFNTPSAGMYEVVGWQGEQYVAVKSKANKLSKLVIEQGNASSDKKTLEVGETWDIGDGWTLLANSINATPNPMQARLVLSKDGTEVDNRSIAQGEIYIYNESLAGETNVPLLVTYVDVIFAGETIDIVQLRYTWAISRNVTIVNVNDISGNLTVVTADSSDIKLKNKDTTVTLARNATVNITGNMKFKVADSDTLRFYPFVAYEVVNSSPQPSPGGGGGGTGVGARQADSVEIRGSVATAAMSWDAVSFPGFWYDLKDDLKTENLSMTQPLAAVRTITENSLWYNTSKVSKMLKVVQNGRGNAEVLSVFPAGNYDVIGWQGKPYVAVKNKANKLSEVVLEQGNATSDKKTLAVGETWNIGDGWALSLRSINANATPMQAWFVLNKDGTEVDNRVIKYGDIYVYVNASLAGETDVPLFVTYVDRIYSDGINSIVQLRYTWAISSNVTEIKVNDIFGNLEVVTADTDTIKLRNEDKTITLTRSATIDIMGDIKFKVADTEALRFYPMVLRTIPGIYEVRGNVATSASNWNATTFAGFWYDLKGNLKTENLVMTQALAAGRTIPENSLWYNTSKAGRTLKVVENGHISTDIANAFTSPSTGMYEVIGWQGEPYVAVKSKANKLSKLVIEQGNSTSEKKTLAVGETWDIGEGWTVSAQSIDAKASPRQVWLVLSKDGIKLDDKVISQGWPYVYVEKNLAGETDVPLFVTYVDSVFAGATDDMVQLRYTWAISNNVTEIQANDVFGNLEVVNADSDNIRLRNKDKTITLTRNASVDITDSIKFRVADSDTLRFYPFVTYTIPYPPPPPPPPEPFDTLRFEPKKWSLVSVPKMLENPAVNAAFSNLSGDMNNMKWYYNGSVWKKPSTIEPLKGYWVYNNASTVIYQKLKYKNTEVPVTPPSTALVTGWNLIGMSNTSTEPIPMETALMTIEGGYSHLLAYDPAQIPVWTTYTPGDSPPRQLEPGRGYWIFMTRDATYGAVGI